MDLPEVPGTVTIPALHGAHGRQEWCDVEKAVSACGGGSRSTPWPRLLFVVVLGLLLGSVGWALLAVTGPAQEWVALLWLASAAGLMPMLATVADRSNIMIHRLGLAGLMVTVVSILTVVLTTGVTGELALPFLPLLIAYTALLLTTGGGSAPRTPRRRRGAEKAGARTRASPSLSTAATERMGPEET